MRGRRRRSAVAFVVALCGLGLGLGLGAGAGRSSAAGIFSKNGPTLTDHWHAAYGVFICNRYIENYNGSADPDVTGIHTHDDGLIHIHPFTKNATGNRATLGVFMATHGYQMQPGVLVLPTAAGKYVFKDGDKCPDGKAGTVRLVQFGGPKDAKGAPIMGFDGTPRLFQDQELAIVFAPPGVTIKRPPSVRVLHSPADVDGGAFSPNRTS